MPKARRVLLTRAQMCRPISVRFAGSSTERGSPFCLSCQTPPPPPPDALEHLATMPPQLGAFAIPYSSQHKRRTPNAEIVEVSTSYQHQPAAGPSRIHGMCVAGPCLDAGDG